MRVADLDLRLLRLARTRGHTPARDRHVAGFSALGEHAVGWLALGLAGALAERRRAPARSAEWLQGAMTVAVAYVANTACKLIVRRARPQLADAPPLVATPTQLSFPSAHATSGFAAARRYGRLMPALPLYGVAGALGASRVYLGVHYPSDVLAGALLGSAVGSLGGARCR